MKNKKSEKRAAQMRAYYGGIQGLEIVRSGSPRQVERFIDYLVRKGEVEIDDGMDGNYEAQFLDKKYLLPSDDEIPEGMEGHDEDDSPLEIW